MHLTDTLLRWLPGWRSEEVATMRPKSPLASEVLGDWFCEALLNDMLMIAVMAQRPVAISAVSIVAFEPGLRRSPL
jgi:hypothetical protein